MDQDKHDYLMYLIYDKKIIQKIIGVFVTVVLVITSIILLNKAFDYTYNYRHFSRGYYPTSYIKTILRQNKKHYQRVADYATSDAILEDYVGEYYSSTNPEYGVEYSICLYDESLKIRDERVITSLNKVTEDQNLWHTHAGKNWGKPCYIEFEFTPNKFEPDGSDNWLRYYKKIDLDTHNSMIEYGYEDLGDGWFYYDRFKKKE